jgi:Tol biopolymer transport system component
MLANLDGTGLRPLRASADDASPEWSPDGRAIAFVESRFPAETHYVWVAKAGGGQARLLGTGAAYRWSPRSDRIAFIADPAERGFRGVRISDLQGRRVRSVRSSSEASTTPESPASPTAAPRRGLPTEG